MAKHFNAMKKLLLAMAFAALAFSPASGAGCTILANGQDGSPLMLIGDECDTPLPPASTFKVPLAVIGFDAGILTGPDEPAWPYKAEYAATRDMWKVTTTPKSWMTDSVLWYSRLIVAELGAERFAAAVANLDYGNADVSGDPGADNGMTRSWLNSSLQITPNAQLDFIGQLYGETLPVRVEAQRQAKALLPVFTAGDWQVRGKTGTAYERHANGNYNYDGQIGWFVGWAQKGDAVVTFVSVDRMGASPAAGPAIRDRLLQSLPELLEGYP